jgi:hypothetical protein
MGDWTGDGDPGQRLNSGGACSRDGPGPCDRTGLMGCDSSEAVHLRLMAGG